MKATMKLTCPSCGVGLRVPETFTAGKAITCPRCATGFAIPASNAGAPAMERAVAKPPKQTPPVEDDDLTDEQEEEARPAPRKRRKKSKKSSRDNSQILGLVLGGVGLVVILGVVGFLVFGRSDPKSSPVPETTQATAPPAATAPRGETEAPAAQARAEGTGNAPVPVASAEGAGSGRQVFEKHNCTRCHTMGGGGGSQGGRMRGPDLSTVGRDPTHTVEWFMTFVRNPRATRPESRMPPYEGKINPQDLRALAEYLASLK